MLWSRSWTNSTSCLTLIFPNPVPSRYVGLPPKLNPEDIRLGKAALSLSKTKEEKNLNIQKDDQVNFTGKEKWI